MSATVYVWQGSGMSIEKKNIPWIFIITPLLSVIFFHEF